MDDLSYREFEFTIDIDTGSDVGAYSGSVSPSSKGIDEEEWAAMSEEDKTEWLWKAARDWLMEASEISWA